MNTDLMFSSVTDQWATPQSFFDEVAREFAFDVDVCASPQNAKCSIYFTEEMNGLIQDWNGICWMNPPYGRDIKHWIQKASESSKQGATVIALLPARTCTQYFHAYIYQKPNVEIRFLKGRLKFGDAKNGAPFPSMLVVFHPIPPTI